MPAFGGYDLVTHLVFCKRHLEPDELLGVSDRFMEELARGRSGEGGRGTGGSSGSNVAS